jgi:hypothetical protein
MTRSLLIIALLGYVASCQRKAEQPPPPPAQPESPPARTPPPVSNRDAAATAPGAAAPRPDASPSDSGGQATAALRPLATGTLVPLDNVGPEPTALEIRVPPRFKVRISKLREEQLPRATLKGPHFSVDVFIPDVNMGSLSRAKEDLKTLYPTVVFDRAEEIPDGDFLIFHDLDAKTQAPEYWAALHQKKLRVICTSSDIKSAQLAEQAISICLSLHDRNAQ